MSIFAKIFLSGEGETILDVEEKLSALDREEAAAHREMEVVTARRNALLISEDDKQLDRDAETAKNATRTLERAGLARQELMQRLSAARQRARNATIDELRQERAGILEGLLAAMIAAVEANEAAMAFNNKVRKNLGDGHVHNLSEPIAHPLLRRDLIDPFKNYLGQMTGPIRHPTTPAPSPVIKKVVAQVSAMATAAVAPKKKPRASYD